MKYYQKELDREGEESIMNKFTNMKAKLGVFIIGK